MHMDCKRKLGYPEETHAGTVRKKDKLHLEFHNHQIWSAGKIYLKPTLPVSPYEPLTFRWCLAFIGQFSNVISVVVMLLIQAF